MFDFGFSELMFIAVVALIVVGPQRLPKLARTAGHLLGRARRYVAEVKSDISREVQLEELKELQQQVQKEARDLETSVREQVGSLDADARRTATELKREVEAGSDTSGPDTAPAQVREASEPVPALGAGQEESPDAHTTSQASSRQLRRDSDGDANASNEDR